MGSSATEVKETHCQTIVLYYTKNKIYYYSIKYILILLIKSFIKKIHFPVMSCFQKVL